MAHFSRLVIADARAAIVDDAADSRSQEATIPIQTLGLSSSTRGFHHLTASLLEDDCPPSARSAFADITPYDIVLLLVTPRSPPGAIATPVTPLRLFAFVDTRLRASLKAPEVLKLKLLSVQALLKAGGSDRLARAVRTVDVCRSLAIRRVTGLSSTFREYYATCCFAVMPLAPRFVGEASRRPVFHDVAVAQGVGMKRIVDDVGEAAIKGLNMSQQRAVSTAVSAVLASTRQAPAFALLQGPPGTGKSVVAARLVHILIATLEKQMVGRRPHVLVCAPSNAAVDECARKLLDPLLHPVTKQPLFRSTSIVRLGKPSSCAYDIRARVCLDNVVARQWDRGTGSTPSLRARQDAVRSATVVMSTLGTAGSFDMAQLINRDIGELAAPFFDAVVVDEAGQATEPSLLVALAHNVHSLVLIGDPQQLPPTVRCPAADAAGLGNSAFERLVTNGAVPILLDRQYRSLPAIIAFPSREFYDGRVSTSRSVLSGGAGIPNRPHTVSGALGPFAFIDTGSAPTESRDSLGSCQNIAEAHVVLSLLRVLFEAQPEAAGRTAILTPYRAQLHALRRLMPTQFRSHVEVTTVDAAQGREFDYVLISCVRAGTHNHGVGFLSDARRINVALTRGRRSVLVVGAADTLQRSRLWSHLITDAKQRNCFVSCAEASLPAFNLKAPEWANARPQVDRFLQQLPPVRSYVTEQHVTPLHRAPTFIAATQEPQDDAMEGN
jgi:hypothetical protein